MADPESTHDIESLNALLAEVQRLGSDSPLIKARLHELGATPVSTQTEPRIGTGQFGDRTVIGETTATTAYDTTHAGQPAEIIESDLL